jgi:hypothetical protein
MITLNQNGMGRIMAPGISMVKDSALSESEMNDLREKFKIQYSRSKGWDPNNLNEDQLKEIHLDKRWVNSNFMLLS